MSNEEEEDFWTSEEGVLVRLDDLSHDFTFRIFNGAVKGYFEGSGFKELTWVSTLRAGHTCTYCEGQHGRTYKAHWFLPRIPSHPSCECGWDVLMEMS